MLLCLKTTWYRLWKRGWKSVRTPPPPPPPTHTHTQTHAHTKSLVLMPRVLKLQCANLQERVLNWHLLRQCSLKIDSGNLKGVALGGPLTRKIDFSYGLDARFLSAWSHSQLNCHLFAMCISKRIKKLKTPDHSHGENSLSPHTW